MSHRPFGMDDDLPAFGLLVALMLIGIAIWLAGTGIGVGLAWLKVNLFGG